MRITIVSGFFLPIPPVAGGAMEKNWWRLGKIYAARGHQVTHISRQWPEFPDDEMIDGVRHLRFSGFDHRSKLWQNLILDALWGMRLLRSLPPADILITNTVALPVIAPYLRPSAGKLVVNLNRFPKGQLKWYKRAVRIQAASKVIAEAAIQQAPLLIDRIRVVPNPIDITAIQAPAKSVKKDQNGTIVLGYLGRIHPEKGLLQLIAAATRLLDEANLPAWRLEIRGPMTIPQGGGGDVYLQEINEAGARLIAANRLRIEPPIYDAPTLYRVYHGLDVFCYPSLAERGEALPIAVLEAMAAHLPVVVTDLDCFADYVRDGRNGFIVPRQHADPVGQLADALRKLIVDASLRRQLGDAGASTVSALDDAVLADQHLADYEQLLQSSAR